MSWVPKAPAAIYSSHEPSLKELVGHKQTTS